MEDISEQLNYPEAPCHIQIQNRTDIQKQEVGERVVSRSDLRYILNRRLGGYQRRSEHSFGGSEKHLLLSEIQSMSSVE
jgi:hypothetical protein